MKRLLLHSILVVVLIGLGVDGFAQSRMYLPFQRQANYPVVNDLDTLGSMFHSDIYPLMIREIESDAWYRSVYNEDYFTEKIFLDLKLNKTSEKNPIKLSVAPVGEFLVGFESGRDATTHQQTGIGINFSAMVGKSLDVNLNFMGSNSSFPSFVESFIFNNQVVPGQGWGYKSDLGYYYNNSNGYISYSPGKYFNFTVGRGKNRFGDGYRSLLLSDIGDNYNYFRITTMIGRFKYVNLYSQLDDVYQVPGAPDNSNRKYSSSHYLSVNIARRWSVGLFESVHWMASDSAYNRGFDPYYMNPIIFLRPVEYSLGSPDNMLMGLNVSFKATNRVKIYGQLLLDEFKLSELRGGNGWWANKFGVQLGAKYYDAFNVKGLMLLGEYNVVRPYTYSHRVPGQAYGHMNQPLAHPSGANFHEGVFIASYSKKRVYVELKNTLLLQGVDSDSISYGGNIFRSEDDRVSDYGNTIGQGVKRTLNTVNLKASYLVSAKANIRGEINLSAFNETVGNISKNVFWVRIGIRTGIFNEDWDF